MARKRSEKGENKKSFVAKAVIGGVLACAIAAGIGFRVAFAGFADATSDLEDGAVGLSTTFKANISVMSFAPADESSSADTEGAATSASGSGAGTLGAFRLVERTQLATPLACDISAGLQAMTTRLEEERRAAEEAARIAEQNHIKEVNALKEQYSQPSGLSEVDWNVGKAAFMEEWTRRIDAYLSGSNLDGYGETFAEAAWEYGVDPRWSPAISNTESSKGSSCFLPHNAWGWGASSWSNWTDAIWAHVAGLSAGYGYGLTQSAAATYCPPNSTNWYNNTLSEMKRI